MMNLEVTTWNLAKDFVKPIRYEAFVKSQSIPEEEEWDELDAVAWHAVLTVDGVAVGTGRLIINGTEARIGRMAIEASYRGRGFGKAVLLNLIEAGKEKGVQEFILHAQVHAISFYAQSGFEPHGPIFDEVGIDHIEMRLEI